MLSIPRGLVKEPASRAFFGEALSLLVLDPGSRLRHLEVVVVLVEGLKPIIIPG